MYIIKKVNSCNFNDNSWENIEGIEITNYPWDTNGNKPKATVKLCYTEDALKLKFITADEKLQITAKEDYKSTWHDNCVEFFFTPMPELGDRYFNFEINAMGYLLLQLDYKVPERHTLDYVNTSIFNIKADVSSHNLDSFNDYKPWTIEFEIPYSFIRDYFPDFKLESGTVFKANLTKCAGKIDKPYFGTWADIICEKPAYHRPQFFKEMILG